MRDLKKRWRGIISEGVNIVLVLAVLAIFLLPLVWLFTMSLKSMGDALAIPPVWVFKPDFSHYYRLLFGQTQPVALPIRPAILNSLIVSLGSTGLAILMSLPCAYSISRYRTGGNGFAFWILSIRMAPPILFMIPLFVLYQKVHLLDTQLGLTLLYLLSALPLCVWVLRSFIDDLPRDFEEAAMIDGCSPLTAMFRVVFPLIMPGITSVAIICFFFSFSEFLMANVFTTWTGATITAVGATFITQYTFLYPDIASVIMVMMAIVYAFVLLIQGRLVRGLTMGAVKG